MRIFVSFYMSFLLENSSKKAGKNPQADYAYAGNTTAFARIVFYPTPLSFFMSFYMSFSCYDFEA
jgi:hypothetical protein